MSNSVSERLAPTAVAVSPATPRRLVAAALLLLLAAAGFAVVQNSGRVPGGGVALPKVLWLAFALYYWFLLPLVFTLDTRVSSGLRRAFRLFLINMGARAVIELWMMYISLNWHPYYGIAHDVFSIVLITVLLLAHARAGRPARLLFYTLPVMGLMFMVEIGFVFYLLNHVATGTEPIYFVPDSAEHRGVLGVSWGVVALLAAHMGWLFKRGLHGTVER